MLITVNRSSEEAKTKIREALLSALGKHSGFDLKLEELSNVKLSNENHFWRSRTHYSFDAEVYCGGLFKYEGTWHEMMLYFYANGQLGGGGFAVLVPGGSSGQGQRPVRYFTWQKCLHEYEEKTIGHCLRRYTCKHCGHHYEVDSSD